MTTKLLIVSISAAVLALNIAEAQECDEFISPHKPTGQIAGACRVTIDMTALAGDLTSNQTKVAVPVHADVMMSSKGQGTIVLTHASPFLSCSLAATPAPVTRDLSMAITALLTTVGTFQLPNLAPSVQAFDPLTAIYDDANSLKTDENLAISIVQALPATIAQSFKDNWRYSFDSPTTATTAINALKAALSLIKPQNDLVASFALRAKALQDDLVHYRDANPGLNQLQSTRYQAVRRSVFLVSTAADQLQSFLGDLAKKYQPYSDALAKIPAGYTDITLAMTRYGQKQVTETITCKDVATGTQPFDNMIFTAYYENTPVFDVSAGALMSFTPGRQVGAVSGPISATAQPAMTSGSCAVSMTPETCLEVTTKNRVQFMPATFVEWHPMNGKCSWANNGDSRHAFGYVCSLGLAGGLAVNPNNGTGTAEFFEGASLAIQRISLLFGVHNGRYQTFADGYYVGEAVPPATTPRTERIWTNHIAVGITYRLPLR